MRGGPALSEAKAREEKSSKGTIKAERGSAGGSRVTPPCRERTFQVHKSLSYALLVWAVHSAYSSERVACAAWGDVVVSFFGSMPRCRSLGRCRRVVLRNGAKASSLIERCIRLKG